ncbi:MAG: NRDE family protein [Rhodospirillaceae bacterium]|nr:NRDE family protein [Rhodospirillaceae bacterium]
MCTVILDRRPDADWPIVLAAIRDERLSRTWRSPARHWPDRPEVTGGLDDASGGSWMAMNDAGVVAIVVNRRGTLGPAPGKRSRGELVLEALDHADAVAAATALADLNPEAYRPFNMVVADNRDGFWIANRAESRVAVMPLPEGLSLLAADELNDPASPRDRFRARLAMGPRPDPARDDWHAWLEVMALSEHDPQDGPLGGMTVVTDRDYGTVCASLVGLPAPGLIAADGTPAEPVWLFAPGRPGDGDWQRVAAEAPAPPR